jgi:hypothetical protein
MLGTTLGVFSFSSIQLPIVPVPYRPSRIFARLRQAQMAGGIRRLPQRVADYACGRSHSLYGSSDNQSRTFLK